MDEETPNIYDLNRDGMDFEYVVIQNPGGSVGTEKRLICAGKVLNPNDMVEVIRQVNALIDTGRPAAE